MNIRIQTMGIELTAAIAAQVEKKMQALEKYLHTDTANVDVEVGKTTGHHNKGQIFFCEAHVRAPGVAVVRTREEGEDLYAAIDEVHDELQRQLVDLKERRLAKRRGGFYAG
ncbi:MAG: ribosome-associated translation inhibitor RaiA [Patescibacteria group bacterium]